MTALRKAAAPLLGGSSGKLDDAGSALEQSHAAEEALRALFDKHDADCNGILDVDELQALLSEFFDVEDWQAATRKHMHDKADKNNDGGVDFDGFIAFHNKLARQGLFKPALPQFELKKLRMVWRCPLRGFKGGMVCTCARKTTNIIVQRTHTHTHSCLFSEITV